MNRRRVIAGAAACMGWTSRIRPESGASFGLAGTSFRLADIIAPETGDPHAQESRRRLYEILAQGLGEIVDVAPRDRWGRRVIRARCAALGRSSVQEVLVAAGAARVRPETEDYQELARLLDVEHATRMRGIGQWRLRAYRVRSPDDARFAVGAFHLVEGAVRRAYAGRGRVYLNFGEDFRSDFTVTAGSREAKRWKKSGLDLAALSGARVRVRGYCAWINGPSIEILHPMQLEALASGGAPQVNAALRGQSAAPTTQATASQP